MDQATLEIALIEKMAIETASAELHELNSLQLAMIGGGIADGSFH